MKRSIFDVRQDIIDTFEEALENALYAAADPETGEITDEAQETAEKAAFEAVAGLNMELDERLENLALWRKELKAEAEAIKKQKLILQKRQASKERTAERIDGLLAIMLNGQKREYTRVSIFFRKSVSCEADVEKIPEEYYKPVKPAADLTKIKKALQAGEVIEGAQLIEKQSVIYK